MEGRILSGAGPGEAGGGATPPATLVIGGGAAGLAAATSLAEAGRRVVVLESRPHLGGRARSWIDPDTGAVVDNGQHLFMGCYRETRRLLARLGTSDRLDLQPSCAVAFVERGGREVMFRLPRAPRPLNLLAGLARLPGLSPGQRLGMLRVALAALRRGRRGALRLDGISVAGWLGRLGQAGPARERFWDPMVIATLNEEPAAASAACFLPVVRAMLLGGTDAARFGLARVGLSDLYAEPAAHYLRSRGCEVRLRSQVRQIVAPEGRCTGVLLADGTILRGSPVIAAVPPRELLAILPEEVAADPFFARVGRLDSAPIVSLYLWFGAPVIERAFAGLLGGRWHWIFNRSGSVAGSGQAVVLVRSAARDMIDRPREWLIRSGLDDLHDFFPASRRATVRQALVIKERQATFAPAPGSAGLRPAPVTPWGGLLLAGDWTATGLPATIEGAVLSGHGCARHVLSGDRSQPAGVAAGPRGASPPSPP